MPTFSTRASKAKIDVKKRVKSKSGRRVRQPSFAAAMKPLIGMVKDAPSDLSTREGFGD